MHLVDGGFKRGKELVNDDYIPVVTEDNLVAYVRITVIGNMPETKGWRKLVCVDALGRERIVYVDENAVTKFATEEMD